MSTSTSNVPEGDTVMKSLSVLKNECIKEVNRAYNLADDFYGTKFTRVPVLFNNRLTVSAGIARFIKGRDKNNSLTSLTPAYIMLSTKLLMANKDKFIIRTPAHEVAHVVSIEEYGIKAMGHGKEFVSVMEMLDRETSACHKYKFYTKADKLDDKPKVKRVSMASEVRQLILSNMDADIPTLMELVSKSNIGLRTSLIKRYVVNIRNDIILKAPLKVA